LHTHHLHHVRTQPFRFDFPQIGTSEVLIHELHQLPQVGPITAERVYASSLLLEQIVKEIFDVWRNLVQNKKDEMSADNFVFLK